MTRTLLLLLAALLMACASAPPTATNVVDDQVVVARLDEARGMPVGCGVLAFYGPATYTVLEGPAFLQGKKIEVLVWCLDDSQRESPKFRVGRAYRLTLTKAMPHPGDFDQPLGPGPYAFYLRGDPEPMAQDVAGESP